MNAGVLGSLDGALLALALHRLPLDGSLRDLHGWLALNGALLPMHGWLALHQSLWALHGWLNLPRLALHGAALSWALNHMPLPLQSHRRLGEVLGSIGVHLLRGEGLPLLLANLLIDGHLQAPEKSAMRETQRATGCGYTDRPRYAAIS